MAAVSAGPRLRARTTLDGTTWLQLGRVLGARSHGAAAHGCRRAAAATAADEAAVDKARLQLAVSSLEAGCAEESLRIYETSLTERRGLTVLELVLRSGRPRGLHPLGSGSHSPRRSERDPRSAVSTRPASRR